MAKVTEKKAPGIGKCTACGYMVMAGEETYTLEKLFHKDCDDENKREINYWNEEVKKDREARG